MKSNRSRDEELLPVAILLHALSPLCQRALFEQTPSVVVDSKVDDDAQRARWLSVVHMATSSTSPSSSWAQTRSSFVDRRRLENLLDSGITSDEDGGGYHPRFRLQKRVPTSLLPASVTLAPSSKCSLDCLTHCHVLVPSDAAVGSLHHSNVMRSSQIAVTEMKRQYSVRCEIARVMTLGGGWASVKNAKEALKCTIRLYQLADMIGDEATKRKCRVFVGWAMLWQFEQQQQQQDDAKRGGHHNEDHVTATALQKALWIFTTQLQANRSVSDDTNWNRCFAALYHWSFLTNEVQGNSAKHLATPELVVDGYDGPKVAAPPTDAMAHGDIAGEPTIVENHVLDQWEQLFV